MHVTIMMPLGLRLSDLQSGLRMDGLRRMLGRFGLSGHHHLQPIQKLSGAIGICLLEALSALALWHLGAVSAPRASPHPCAVYDVEVRDALPACRRGSS
jgi:hypothetical protein